MFTIVSETRCFNGILRKVSHKSECLGGLDAKLNVFIPGKALKDDQSAPLSLSIDKSVSVPVIFYLSGLTCTCDNAVEKGGFLGPADEHGIAMVFPDTSPRGAGIEGEDNDWDFGTGAGFYIDATKGPYEKNYKMYTYVNKELPDLIFADFPFDSSRQSIMGHSMGGLGALLCFLKNPNKFKSVSLLAPICNPSKCSWGKKAFSGYLKEETEWNDWDPVELIEKNKDSKNRLIPIMIDQGKEDDFYKQLQLLPENFGKTVEDKGWNVTINYHAGFNHSYYFVQSFAKSHIDFHDKHLNPTTYFHSYNSFLDFGSSTLQASLEFVSNSSKLLNRG